MCAGWLCTLFGVVQAHRTSSKTYTNHISTEIARCVEVSHWSSGWFDRTEPSLCPSLQGKQGVQSTGGQGGSTVPNLLYLHCYRGNKECRVLMQEFGVVQAQRTSSNLLEPQHHRDSKVWRGLSHEFGVVRLYRTFSIYIIAGETRCAGCLCTRSGWFKHIEPHRTYSNHNITEIARCGEVCHMSSGWFDCTEPSLSTALQGFV